MSILYCFMDHFGFIVIVFALLNKECEDFLTLPCKYFILCFVNF